MPAKAVDPEHLVLGSSYGDRPHRMVDLSGRTVWEFPHWVRVASRTAGLTVLCRPGPLTTAIDDSGTVRWQAEGYAPVVSRDVAWVKNHDPASGYGVPSGALLWTVEGTGVSPAQFPALVSGFHPGDGYLLSHDDNELAVYG
ncbi:MAG TPA: hypothetical protein VFE14_20275 [Micromonosporaceae bacterium]|jgi:hypothetical protein|nr:hypothetical protein [Micromonosporaceae bacterium]